MSKYKIQILVSIALILINCSSIYSAIIENSNTGFEFYKSWESHDTKKAAEFWSINTKSLTKKEQNIFNNWHIQSKFKDISPKFGNGYFFKSPWQQRVYIDSEGSMVFERIPVQKQAHTMIEISVNNQPSAGQFINYGGYRSMKLGIPYEIEFEVLANNGQWISNIPWLIVFQGHAIPDIFDKGKKFNPPFALVISKGRWEAHIRADSRLSLPHDKSYERFDRIDLGKVDPDVWTRFTIKVMWGYNDFPKEDATALGLWRDGKQIGRAHV